MKLYKQAWDDDYQLCSEDNGSCVKVKSDELLEAAHILIKEYRRAQQKEEMGL